MIVAAALSHPMDAGTMLQVAQLFSIVVAVVWVVASIRTKTTELAQTISTLSSSVDKLDLSIEKLDTHVRSIDRRVTVLEVHDKTTRKDQP